MSSFSLAHSTENRNHGNEQRSLWRKRCRERLSQNICKETNQIAVHKQVNSSTVQQLQIKIDPKDVRLRPRPDDPYRWQVPRSKSRLFKKQISKHCIRDSKEIFNSIGISINAVPKEAVADISREGTEEV